MKSTKKIESQFVCKPLDSYSEILLFLENPPPWRTLCQEMTPHSDYLIRNIEINNKDSWSLMRPENFCHFDPDLEDVKRYESKSLPKTLVCHDMANGYHDDSVIEGTSKFDAYTFYNWAGIDIFCYFSHHLITIPPVGWINVGHAHGVKVIGTIITEWGDGIGFWDQVLSSETKYQDVASALVAIAKTLKFDGYLLNVENKVTHPDMLLQFVKYFHRMLHAELPHATLLWYDSVTISGTLNWQNKLNEKNMAFFEACDGLFTNYSWTKEDVESSAALAGSRITDLYIGIDVWGRNFYGGGQFNTQEAVKVVHAAGCSLAVFAPAWTHEALGAEHAAADQASAPSAGAQQAGAQQAGAQQAGAQQEGGQPAGAEQVGAEQTAASPSPSHVAMGEDMEQYAKVELRERALWGSLWPFLNTRVPNQLPFQTSFCRGLGKKRFLYGEQYQPNSAHGPHGYILTPLENLATVHRAVQYKDKKGIIRIRNTFQQNRHSLHATKDTLHEEAAADAEDAAPPDADTKQYKAKTSLRNMFRPKALRISSDDGESAAAGRAADAQPGAEADEASVNLKLGVADKMRYGLARVRGEHACLELYLRDAFSGGSCLRVNPSDELCAEHRVTRLLHCDWPCETALIFCVVTKRLPAFPDQSLNVKLYMKNAAGQDLVVVLTGREVAAGGALGAGAAGTHHVYPLRTAAEPVLRALRTYLLLSQPGFYVPIDNLFGWTVRYYEVEVPGARVTSVNLRTAMEQGGILLGHFAVCRKLINQSWTKTTENTVSLATNKPAQGFNDDYEDLCVAQ
ncbi:unnamed protein product [Spodoptera littoralis]|uniref:Cytosolic endo-beta-N-acetylglucosaminidase TIM barrel domain-containing protein n=1 Tax=Spodoptera littoralis TaxID=7109 RepID=A0A9P0NAJ2_SPOLI|nr:unnamed protein product [Spodoptera littoralis]CAH1645788.1 unnamed protein product [Spodoptera littoralis]